MNLQKTRRSRGLILTHEGWQKFQNARFSLEIQEKSGDKFTLEELSERIGLTTVTLAKVLACKEGVDKRTLVQLFMAFSLELNRSDYSQPDSNSARYEGAIVPLRRDWGEATDVSVFYGRTEELATLEKWTIEDRCRLVAVLGMGGIGKTSLAAKLAEQIKHRFEYVIWRSLSNAPPLENILVSLIQFLSNEQAAETDLPDNTGGISRLMEYLRSHRCLIVLDNAETIMQSGAQAGCYVKEYADYGQLLQRVGEVPHQSCLVLTSREKPKEVASLAGESLPVRSLQLSGLKEVEGQKIFQLKGVSGLESELRILVERYAGNALALKIVATTIQDVFDGNVAGFLQQDTAVFGDIRELLEQQFERLSEQEKEIMYWLAINREPVSLSELRSDIVSPVPQPKLIEALESLARRCLIDKAKQPTLVEKSAALFTLQPVVMEYMTERLVGQVCLEIFSNKLEIFRCHALIKAQGKDYVRDTQVRLLLKPVVDGLLTVFRRKINLENQLTQILATLRETSPLEPGYTAGNILNLLCHLETDLSGYDFSHLAVWQADLRNVNLHNVNFQNADLNRSVFAETFGGVLSVAFSPDGKLLAMGDSKGEIRLYQIANSQHLLTCKGHTNWVVSLAFNPNGKTIASSSTDYAVKLWDISTGQCLQTLQGHEHEVWSVAFSPDGQILASGSDDQTMRLWSVSTGECKRIFQGHTNLILSVAFAPDGQVVASGSDDHTIRLYDVNTGECERILQGHRDGIRSITLSPDGRLLASGSEDRTVKLWDVSTGECLKTLQGHSNAVFSVAFNPQGNVLVSGSYDSLVKLWSVSSGECLKTFQGHQGRVWSVAFSPQGDFLASGSHDQTVRLWSVSTGQCFKTFQGHANQILSIAFSPDSQMLVSGSNDCIVRLWNVSTGQILRNCQGHCALVWSVAFSPDGQKLASGSDDHTVRLWNVSSGECLKTCQGHRAAVFSVAFSPNGQTLGSGSDDQTVRLWDINTGQALRILQGHSGAVFSVAFSPQGTMLASGAFDQKFMLWDTSIGECLRTSEEHTSWVWSVAFSPDGELLASTSSDGTLRFWNVRTGKCLRTLQVDTGWLQSVTFSPDGQTLAGCSQDYTLKLWDVSTGQCLKTLQGHTARVWSAVFSPDRQTLASSSEDETIRLWDVKTGKCLKILETEKPYESMSIIGVTGLTEATLATLKALGAVD